MRKLFMALIILIAMTASVSAQVPNPFSLYVGGAISLPMSDGWKAAYNNGLHGSIGVGYNMAPGLQMVGKIEYHTFKFDFDNAGMTDMSGGTNKIWMFGVDGRYAIGLPAAPIKPYIIGGVGMARIQQSEFAGGVTLATNLLNQFIPDAQNKMYFNMGAGVSLKSGPAWSLFAQARWVNIASDGGSAAFVPITLGLKFF